MDSFYIYIYLLLGPTPSLWLFLPPTAGEPPQAPRLGAVGKAVRAGRARVGGETGGAVVRCVTWSGKDSMNA